MPLIVLILILLSMPVSAAEKADTITRRAEATDSVVHENIFEKVIHYFEDTNKDTLTCHPKFSFIGGPHYSSDTKFGIGLLAAGLYSTNPEDCLIQPSEIALAADLTTANCYKVSIGGTHFYKKNTRRLDYDVSFKSYSTYYWGIGVDEGLSDENKTRYRLLSISVNAAHLWLVRENIFCGPLMEFTYASAHNRSNTARWRDQPLRTYTLKFGGTFRFDSRDNYSAPNTGWLGELSAGYNQGLESSFNGHFYSVEFNICNFLPLWKSGTLASRLHGELTFGDTPWTQMPTLGVAGTMRGYYEGQYRDKNETDLTLELRQHVFKRSGIVVFGGFGAVFPSFSRLATKHFLPSYGIGYRWEFKKNTNIRVDFGFGKKCWGVEFNVGEAF